MVRKAIALTLLIGSCFTSVVFAADPNCRDTYIVPGRAAMFEGSLSGLREAYTFFNAGVQDTNKCTSDRELKFLHAVTGTAMLFIDNNDVALQNSFLELAEEFGVEVLGDYFETLDINVPLTDGRYKIPSGAPDANEISDMIHNSIIPEVNDIIAELDSISDSDSNRFRIFFKPDETGLGNDLEVDYGEVLILKGLLFAFKSQLEAESAYDTFMDVNETLLHNLLYVDGIGPDTKITDAEMLDFLNIPVTDPNQISINDHFLGPYPNLLKVLPTSGHPEDGTAILAKARQDLINGINYYLDAINYIRSETDPQEDDLLYIDPNDTLVLDAVNVRLTTLRDSLKNDTVGTYPVETTKTYKVYDSNSKLIGQLIFSYELPGLDFDGEFTFTGGGMPSPWNAWFSWDGIYGIEADVEYYQGGQWAGGYFSATLSQDGKSFSGGTFEYWGDDSGTITGLSGKLTSTKVVNGKINLNPIFGSKKYPKPVNPRDLLPLFDQNNVSIAGTMGHGLGNDATLGGIFPGMTQGDWTTLFGLASALPDSLPNLVGQSVSSTLPVPSVPGDKGKVSIVIGNWSNHVASGKINIDIYASLHSIDQPLDSNDIKLVTLANQSVNIARYSAKTYTASVQIPSDIEPGDYYILANIDPNNAIAESDDVNNLAVSNITYEIVWKFGSFDDRKNVKLIVNDSNGTPVTFALTGGGYGVVNGSSDFNEVVLNDTTDKSQLTITTTGKGKETSVGDIIVHGSVKDIIAKTTDLRGDVVIDGSCRMLVFDDIAGEHTITIGSSSDPKAGATIICDQVSDCGIESGIPITRLTATEWLDTAGKQIQASRIDTLQIKGDKKRGLAGDFQGSLQLSGSTDPKKSTLGNGKIAGTMSNDSDITGNVGTLNIKALHGGLHIGGDAKNIIIGEPMSLPVESVTPLGELLIDGTGTVKSAKETIKGQDIDLCTRDTVGIYRLEDLRRYDVLGAWWDYEGDYSVKVTGEPKEVNTVDFTTTVSEIVDINGHDCFKVTTSALDTNSSMAWYTDSNGTYLAAYVGGGMNFDMDLEMSSTLVAPQYLELGKTYKGSGPISGEFTVYGTPHGDLVGTVNGTIKTTCKLVKHEQVLVGSDTYLAARIDFGMTMQGQIDIPSPPVTATYKATLTQTCWAVPDIGTVKANTTKYEVKVSIPGEGSTTSTGNEVDELTDYGP